MTRVQKLTPLVALVIMLLAVGYSLLPFDFAEGVSCSAPLLGAEPETEQSVGLILPEEDCLSKGRSRLLVSAMVSLVAAAATAAVVGLRPISPQCSAGNHDDCPDWWANLLSERSGLGCQCECHAQRGSLF